LKSELARRLAIADPPRAQREMEEVERVSRHALAEVRAAVTGMRRGDLAAEIISARLMLEASDVAFEASLPVSLDLPPDTEATLALVDRLKYAGLFGFKYSERPFTPALKLGDDVSEDEKSARLEELFSLGDGHRKAHLSSLVGSVQDVLVEGQGKTGSLTGRSERNEIVHFPGDRALVGRIVQVRIREAFKNSLAGEPLQAARVEPKGRQFPRSLPVVG